MESSTMRRCFRGVLVLLWVAAFWTGGAVADIVHPGSDSGGSYTTSIPAPVAVPGGQIALNPPVPAPNVALAAGDARKVPTNDWWTPLAWVNTVTKGELPDEAPNPSMTGLTWQVFSDPLVMQPQKGGLMVSLNIPDSRRAGVKDGTLTAGAGFMQEVVGGSGNEGISPYFNGFVDQDLYLGSTASGWSDAAFSAVKVTGWSDWFVAFTMEAPSKETLHVTAGNGSPFLLVETESGSPQVNIRTWNTGTVVPLEGNSVTLGMGDVKDQTISSDAFALINEVAYGDPAPYKTYVVYAFFGPKETTWSLANDQQHQTGGARVTCSDGRYYAVAVLPYPWGKTFFDKPDEEEVRKLLAFFAERAFAKVTDTKATPTYRHDADGADVKVAFSYTTAAVGGESVAADVPIRAMYPHHYLGQSQVTILDASLSSTSASSWNQGWYWPSLKGPMLMASGASFENHLEVPPCLPAVLDGDPGQAKADRMAGYLRQALETQHGDFSKQGSYFGAQEMHRLAMLLPVAEMIREAASEPASVDQTAKEIYRTVSGFLADRLRADHEDGTPKTAAEHVFYYDSRWGTLIPCPDDGFAADSQLNDHHFHYGYFVKTATELARWEKTHPDDPDNTNFAETYAPMLRLLIRDIAGTSRTGTGTDPDFPFLRSFSPYAGHSWASGSSRGNQGGQQESSSEAIQAWAALLLWAQLDYPQSGGNGDLETWAAYMFASEVLAAELYWFGVTDDAAFRPYLSFRQYAEKTDHVPLPYKASIVSQVNQSEMTFQTDFGNKTLLKYGIQWLPFTGSSLYLGFGSSSVADTMVDGYQNDYGALGAGVTPPSNLDKLFMYKALTSKYAPEAQALITADANGVSPLDSWKMQWEVPAPDYSTLILQDTSRGAMYWWIDTNLKHGSSLHKSLGADHASAAAYLHADGRTTYTAHNPGYLPLRVTFADGNVLEVPPLEYAHEEKAPGSGGGGCAVGALSPGVSPLLIVLAGVVALSLRRR